LGSSIGDEKNEWVAKTPELLEIPTLRMSKN
jgi:hypothetical protein